MFIALETASKLKLQLMGNIIISKLTEIKFEIWRVTFMKSILPLRNYGMSLPEIMEDAFDELSTCIICVNTQMIYSVANKNH